MGDVLRHGASAQHERRALERVRAAGAELDRVEADPSLSADALGLAQERYEIAVRAARKAGVEPELLDQARRGGRPATGR